MSGRGAREAIRREFAERPYQRFRPLEPPRMKREVERQRVSRAQAALERFGVESSMALTIARRRHEIGIGAGLGLLLGAVVIWLKED